MKCKPPTTDTRLDWRDPNMPVIGKSGRKIDHKKMEAKAQIAMYGAEEPFYWNDPTYNLKRRHS